MWDDVRGERKVVCFLWEAVECGGMIGFACCGS